MVTVDAEAVRRWLRGAAETLHERRDELTQLDAAIGDADHGVNMDRGFTAVVTKLGEMGDVPPGRLLIAAGATLISTVGGASGPLWGTALRRMGRALGDAEVVDGPALAGALDAALAGVVELGGAQEGDKTMVDALAPAARALRERLEGGAALDEALAAAREAAEGGMRATVPLEARKGRASFRGEGSVGHQVPGASSSALFYAALVRALAGGG
jgi:dihydroxyacetone kinase-like protein